MARALMRVATRPDTIRAGETEEFGEWWNQLNAAEQKSVDFTVSLLQEAGATLRMPLLRHRDVASRPYA